MNIHIETNRERERGGGGINELNFKEIGREGGMERERKREREREEHGGGPGKLIG